MTLQYSNKTEPNDPAFAAPESYANHFVPGLTKREYFAAHIVAAIAPHCTTEKAAAEAVKTADALIAALNL